MAKAARMGGTRTGVVRTLFATLAMSATALGEPVFAQETAKVSPQMPAQIAPQAPARRGPASVADIAEGLLDSVVNISTTQTVEDDTINDSDSPVPTPKVPEGSPFQDLFKDFFNNKGGGDNGSQKVQSLGSGFVIDAEKGLIATNNHVIADADEIMVNFNDGAKLKAELVGKDTKTDLALLRVDPKKHKLKAVAFGNSDQVRIGDWVLAIGNPFGLGGTVTAGIVSARKRDINSGPYDNFIQTDAAINRGNSGGPLFDMDGKVIGINTAIISPSGGSIGIGFAIPAEMAVNVLDQLKEFGVVRRGWLGVRIQPVTEDVAQTFGLKEAKGALVAGLIEGSGVDNKAIEPGDVVIRFDGHEVASARDLPRLVAESPVGSEAELVVIRNGEEKTLKVKLGLLAEDETAANSDADAEEGDAVIEDEKPDQARPDKPGKEQPGKAGTRILGMSLAALSDDLRSEYGIADDVTGVVVVHVASGSAAGEKRIETGDVIVDVGSVAVKTPEDVRKRIEALRREGRKNALVMLASRSGELRFVTIRID
ncbi:Do family serine endopeptidase [Daeguia caeni]|uniref:Probable periplasmic serine endoprotease DegP-like n=1 Tax=Daeguia caeni TaxID=439612 RepID=A0ABV9H7R9_9HYPH